MGDRALRYYNEADVADLHPSPAERRAMRAVLTWLSLHAYCAVTVGKGKTARYKAANLSVAQLREHDVLVLDRKDYEFMQRALGIKQPRAKRAKR